MTKLKSNLRSAPFGVASILGLLALILLIPGGIMILIAVLCCELGDRLTKGDD